MEKLVEIMPVRNEGWILGFSLRAALMWADQVVLLNHNSTDNTEQIIKDVAAENPGRVYYCNCMDAVWKEMAHRQTLLEMARTLGATHIATVDADEVVTGHCIEMFRHTTLHCDTDFSQLRWLHLWRSVDHVRTDGTWRNQYATTGFRDNPKFGWHTRDGYDHHHRAPFNGVTYRRLITEGFASGLMHFQHVNWRRLLAKQAWYQMIEVTRWPDREPVPTTRAKYEKTVNEEGRTLASAPHAWFEPYRHLLKYLDLDTPPWQEAVVKEMYTADPMKFHGLNLFGVERA